MEYYYVIFNFLAIIEFFLVIILILERLTGEIEGPPKDNMLSW